MALTNKLSAIGDAIREKTGKTDLLTLEQMPVAIASITTGGGGGVEVEPIVLTGDCKNLFTNDMTIQYLKLFGNTISTENITNANNMFQHKEVEEIPFDLNFTPTALTGVSAMFQDAQNLKSISAFRNLNVGTANYMFSGCNNLRYLPEFIDCGNMTTTSSTSSRSQMFTNCQSLREIPADVLNLFVNKLCNRDYYALYYQGFRDCWALNELVGIPVITADLTSNAFSMTVDSCYRLKNFIFETNEDGTPISVNWKNQTINLASQVGYGYATINSKNSGITADKHVYDNATYQALKNNPDWFSNITGYSRYNHNSAVATINSLPDTSASGGVNTIKFYGVGGARTDGGGPEKLTATEIAVATSKGWTVSIS